MRIFATILFGMLLLACNGQDTICFICYTQQQWDSAMAVCDSQITALEQELEAVRELYQSPELYGDTEITVYDSLGTKVFLKKLGPDLWYNINDGDKRYSFWIVDKNLEIWLGDTLKAKLFLQYELE